MFKRFVPLLLIGLISACTSAYDEQADKLGLPYSYSGIIPCADCEGILLSIGFYKPEGHRLVVVKRLISQGTINGDYVESEEIPALIRTDGSRKHLILNPDDSTVIQSYEFTDSTLTLLDIQGNAVQNDFGSYVLKRE